MDQKQLEDWLVSVIEHHFGPKDAQLAKKWEGGTVVLKPAGDQQAKEIPIDVLFKKVTAVRDSLRVLEQKLNTNGDLSANDRTTFQSYITKAYGALTTFNVLFANSGDRFVGAGKGPKSGGGEKMTLAEAQRRVGLNEHGTNR